MTAPQQRAEDQRRRVSRPARRLRGRHDRADASEAQGNRLVDAKEIFEAKAWNDAPGHFGARIAVRRPGPPLPVGRRQDGGLVPAHPERRDGSEPRRPPVAEARQPPRQDPAVERRRHRAARQSVRRPRRRTAGNLEHGPPQSAGPLLRPRHGHALGDRARPAGRRRAQRHREGQELRLARHRLRRELHARHRDPCEPQQGRHGAAEGVLRAVDRHLGPHDVHGRPVPELEGQPVHRRHGRQLPAARAVLGQRQRRHESRVTAASRVSHPRRAPGPGRLRLHRRRQSGPGSAEQHRSSRARTRSSGFA